MPETVACSRCSRPDAPALPRPPLPGRLGQEILGRVCAGCWEEWQKAEVMVINELRLNFMDPAAQETLSRSMREFLYLDGPPPKDGPSSTLRGMSPESPLGEPSEG